MSEQTWCRLDNASHDWTEDPWEPVDHRVIHEICLHCHEKRDRLRPWPLNAEELNKEWEKRLGSDWLLKKQPEEDAMTQDDSKHDEMARNARQLCRFDGWSPDVTNPLTREPRWQDYATMAQRMMISGFTIVKIKEIKTSDPG